MNKEMFTGGNENPKITKVEVLGALEKAKGLGIEDIDATSDPKAKEAQDILAKYRDQLDKEAETIGTNEARLLANFEKSVVPVDAGLGDVNYIRDVIGWLSLDLDDAEGQGETVVVEKIKAKIAELEK